MDLPTFIVILFLSGGTVYSHTEAAPSMEACVKSLPLVKNLLASKVKEPIDMYTASCLKMRPFERDA